MKRPLDHYRRPEFEAALQHGNRFNTPSIAWDPILRAAALGQLGCSEDVHAALGELIFNFPEATSDPAHYLRGYIFIDELVDGLRKASWDENESVFASAAK